jgi:hypothetical protein
MDPAFCRSIEEDPDTGNCTVVAIEVKKYFKEEWTRGPNHAQIQSIGEALPSMAPGVLDEQS